MQIRRRNRQMASNCKRMRMSEDSTPASNTNINDLPQVILSCILSLLPLKEKVASSIVCRAWRYLWLSSPVWTLLSTGFPRAKNKKQKFEELVDKIIFFPGRPGIREMRLVHTCYDGTSQRASLWIESLLDRGILLLDLNITDPIPPPLSLFRSATLVELRLCLHNEVVRVPPTVLIPRLQILSLVKALFRCPSSLQSLINGCSVLVTLEMKECVITGPEFADITIAQSTLAELVLEKCHLFHDSRLHVLTVSLSKFKYVGFSLIGSGHNLAVQESVHSSSVESEENLYIYHNARSLGFSKTYGDNMSAVMAAFCNTRDFILSDWCIEYLTNIPNDLNFPPFGRLESLCLSMWPNSGHVFVIAYLVSFAPSLRSLRVNVADPFFDRIYEGDRSDYPTPDPNFMSSERRHYNLKRVEINKKQGMMARELVLIKFLLRAAVHLQQLVVRCQFWGDPAIRKTMRNMLRSYPRASESVKVINVM